MLSSRSDAGRYVTNIVLCYTNNGAMLLLLCTKMRFAALPILCMILVI
jgi:hypothetical protein